jgi:hypothetical protein
VVYFEPNRISFSQVYPFYYFGDSLRRASDVDISFYPVGMMKTGQHDHSADFVLFQVWIDTPDEDVERIIENIRRSNPGARMAFVDSFANSDIRFARLVAPYVDYYLKKSLFRDLSQFFRPYMGGTNLTDYYDRLYGIEEEIIDWNVPESIQDKLRLLPNFFTAPNLMPLFEHRQPDRRKRPPALHARLETKGTPWYSAMRHASLRALEGFDRMKIVSGPGVKWSSFMKEMEQCAACLSPFGYGELCWRDIECFATGAVLVKQDMSHLETYPDLYIPFETYVPVKWDFSDLQERLVELDESEDLRLRLASRPFQIIRDYLEHDGFAGAVRYLFER